MRILITGICGFVGSTLAHCWTEAAAEHELHGVDNLVRLGSEVNRSALKRLGVTVTHGDLRTQSDVDSMAPVDWVIDAAANPAVLAGVDGKTTSRQLVEHNLCGTINLLEYCRAHRAGFILLSTSRVYSIAHLSALRVVSNGNAFRPDSNVPIGVSPDGVTEDFSTDAPLSLYGATKRASEQLALEYGETFGFPVWINRCGVLAGPGQFARFDQGIFSYWIHNWRARQPLKYLGFGGSGHQVRDCLHPRDLVPLLDAQMTDTSRIRARTQNVSGGIASAVSLKQCSDWCAERFGPHSVESSSDSRRFDVPWLVLDSSLASRQWNWAPSTSRESVFNEIARYAEAHPEWLELSRG